MLSFAANLRALLTLRKADPTQFALSVGYPVQKLEAWMNGRQEPTLSQLLHLADALQIGVERLLRGSIIASDALSRIRMLVLDVDAVLTDGGIYMTESGDEFKKFHARDGRGIMSAQKAGIEIAFLSGGVHNEAVRRRAQRLGVVRSYVGKVPKAEILEGWMAESGYVYSEVAFIGDDANDLELISKVGFSACPCDAAPRNRASVDLILKLPGGQGCVREFIEDHLGITID